jgi:hypothetical protein
VYYSSIASNILGCILKDKHEVSNFPSSIFKEINEVVLKVLATTKERDLALICLNMLCQLIQNEAVKDGSFMELANLFFEQVKASRGVREELPKMIFSLKSLTKLMTHSKETKLNVVNLKKMQKKLSSVCKYYSDDERRSKRVRV